MQFIKKKKPVQVCTVDIHENPMNPGNSRIPVNTGVREVNEFLKQEISATQYCACPCCDYRRHMLRMLQQIVREWWSMKSGQYNLCKCCTKK